MTLSQAPRAARMLGLLTLLFVTLCWLALAMGVLEGLRAETGHLDPEQVLAGLAAALPLSLPVAGFVAVEAMAFLLGSRLLRPAGVLAELSRAAARQDFSRAPRPGREDELGRLATAFGRLVRHLGRRRQELDWMRGEALVPEPDGDDPLALLPRQARFAAAEPAPAEAWLDTPGHRLQCVLAAAVAVLAAAPLGLGWAAPVAAAALFGGRLAEPLRGLGRAGCAVVLAAGIGLWLMTEPAGAYAPLRALGVAWAASVAVHLGGGWRGPSGGGGDPAWLRAGLAGGLAGGGVAAALLGMMGDAAAALVPLLLSALGLAMVCLAPDDAVCAPARWPGMHAALRLLGLPAPRRAVLAGALPGGLALGTALALAAASPAMMVAAAVGGSLVLSLAAVREGGVLPVRWRRQVACGLFAAAALAGWLPEAPGLAPLLATLAALGGWPLVPPAALGGVTPRQAATLAVMAQGGGLVLALALAGGALMPAAALCGLAALALLPGMLIAGRD